MAKGGSKLLTGIMSFILGFLFAIIVECGAVFGVYWFVMNKDIDTVLSAIGIENKDENGNDKYINTDPNNGGAANLKELIGGLKGLIYENGEVTALGKSFDDFEKLVPATNILLGFLYDTVDEYIELDKDKFESTPLSGLAQVLSDSIMDVKTAVLLEKLGMDSITGEDADAVVKSLVTGAECEYASVYYGASAVAEGEEEPASQFKLPVLYDYYVYNELLSSYSREKPVKGVSAFPANLSGREDLLCRVADGVDGETSYARYALYYVPCRVTDEGIEEAAYSYSEITVSEGSGESAKTFKFTVLEYGEDTDFIAVKPDGNGAFTIDYDAVYAAKNANSMGASDRYVGYSYHDAYARNYYYTEKNADTERYELKTICGKNYFRDNQGKYVHIDALTLYDIVNDPFTPLDSVTVAEVVGENGELAYKVFGKISLGALMRGEVDFDKLAEDVEVGAFITNISPDNKIMAYIAYKISDVERVSDTVYKAVYDKFGGNEQAVTVIVENNRIIEVRAADGSVVEGVKVKDVAALAKDMTVNILMDIRADEAVTAYLGYGLSGVKSAPAASVDPLGNAYGYTGKTVVGGFEKTCYITAHSVGEENPVPVIDEVWYIEDGVKVAVKGTKVSEVSNRLNSFKDSLTIGDMLGLADCDNQLLNAIAGSTISGLEDTIAQLTVSDVFKAEDVEKSVLLRQLKNTKISQLATAIDELLVQSIYAEEVYMLPEGVTSPYEVIDFDESAGYEYFVLKLVEADGKTHGEFESVGTLTAAEYENRGNVTYYTYGGDTGADRKMKIVGFNSAWLYYEAEENGGHALTEINCGSLPEGTERDDKLGRLEEEQFVSGKYYTYGAPKGMWRLVLYKGDFEKGYTINNFNNMVNACAKNVNDATLYALQEAGVIDASADLSKKFNGAELGKMSLKQLIDAVLALAT